MKFVKITLHWRCNFSPLLDPTPTYPGPTIMGGRPRRSAQGMRAVGPSVSQWYQISKCADSFTWVTRIPRSGQH